MTELQITYRPVDELVPYARNARTHSPEQIDRIAASIREYGWTNPILTDGEAGIIAGHGRLAAARKLGLKTVPTIELSGLSEAKKRAYILADNRLALDAGWDYCMLKLELEDLTPFIDVGLTGFSQTELDSLLQRSDTSYIDDMVEDNFAGPDRSATHDQIVRSFAFDSENADVIDDFIKSVGKENVSARILEWALRERNNGND